MTADAAVRGIRSVDQDGSVGILSDEDDPPYDRPPLSKGLWSGVPVDRIWRNTEELGATLHLGRRASRLDRDKHQVTDDRGAIYTYEKLLLATGLTPKRLPDDAPQVIYFRTFRDFVRLREAAANGRRFVVVGGGFIGSEIASSLARQGKTVTMLFPEDRICANILPAAVGDHLTSIFIERGVTVRAGVQVTAVRRSGDKMLVSLTGDGPETLKVDTVVVGIGCEPNTVLAEGAGLEVKDGVLVDHALRTIDPDVYAAGDVAAFWSSLMGRTLRIEHESHANDSGHLAGRGMAGQSEQYNGLPHVYSDLFDDIHYELVGDVDPEMETVEDWAVPLERGIVYHLRSGEVRGVLLWNMKGKAKAARELIRAENSFFRFDDSARIPLD